jgi:hypothetical protein
MGTTIDIPLPGGSAANREREINRPFWYGDDQCAIGA